MWLKWTWLLRGFIVLTSCTHLQYVILKYFILSLLLDICKTYLCLGGEGNVPKIRVSGIKVSRLQNLYISKMFVWVFSILTSCWDLLYQFYQYVGVLKSVNLMKFDKPLGRTINPKHICSGYLIHKNLTNFFSCKKNQKWPLLLLKGIKKN